MSLQTTNNKRSTNILSFRAQKQKSSKVSVFKLIESRWLKCKDSVIVAAGDWAPDWTVAVAIWTASVADWTAVAANQIAVTVNRAAGWTVATANWTAGATDCSGDHPADWIAMTADCSADFTVDCNVDHVADVVSILLLLVNSGQSKSC